MFYVFFPSGHIISVIEASVNDAIIPRSSKQTKPPKNTMIRESSNKKSNFQIAKK